MKKTVFIAFLLPAAALPNHHVYAGVSDLSRATESEISTNSLLEQVRKRVRDVVELATNNGDYLLFRNVTELNNIAETWRNANSELGDKTYASLDKSQQTFFDGLNNAAEKLKQAEDDDVHDVSKKLISELSSQAISDSTVFQSKPAVFSYAPRIVYPGMAKVVSFTIRGINFKKANPRLVTPEGRRLSRVNHSEKEIVFRLPLSAFKFDPSKPNVAKLKLSYLTSKRKREQLDISVMQLPQKLSEFTLQIKTKDTVRDTWEGSRQFYWAGKTESKTLSQGPHDYGWRILASSLRQGQVWGEAGKGCSVASKNDQGFSIELRHSLVNNGSQRNAAPYQYCEWHWKEYFDRKVLTQQPPISGQITWLKGVSIPLPNNTETNQLLVKTWDGNKRLISGSQTTPFLQVVDVGNALQIKPKTPADLNEL
ncbi:MAG: hypothetical protein ACU836_06405 [Gammaproteobacteria bacterium]